jgi:hypothetical protein
VSNLVINSYALSGSGDFTVQSAPPNGTILPPGSSANYCFTFTPSGSGNRTATFTLVTSGKDSGTQQIVLSGNGLLPNVAYNAVDMFRKVRTRLRNTSAPKYVTIQNIGTAPLTVSSAYFVGLDAASYTISRMPANVLAPNAIDSFGIVFNPTIEGRPDAAFVINTDANNIPHDTIKMLGIGVLPRLVLNAPAPGSGTNMRFDSVAIGDSVCQSVSLSNPGSDTLHFVRQIMSSADYDFSFYPLTGTDTLILPGATKLVNVCFHPIKNGNRLATIRFYTDIPRTFDVPSRDTSQFALNITGIGVPYGVLAFRGPLVDTSEVTKTVCFNDTLTNTGQSDLTVTGATLSGAGASSFTWNGTLPMTLIPGQTKVVQVCFSPTVAGSTTATLTLTTTSAGRTNTSLVPVSGFGVQYCATSNPVSAVPFSATTSNKTLLKTTATSDVVVTNCGNVPATYTVSALTAPYSVTPSTSGAIVPGGTATFTVSFAPTTMGAVAGTLTITGGPTPMALTLGGIGGDAVLTANNPNPTVDLGDKRNIDVVVTNHGNMDWTAGTPTIGGPNAADFAYSTGPGTIAAGGTGTVTLVFTPTITGPETATLTFAAESPVPSAGATTLTVGGIGAATGGVTEVTEQNGFVLGQSYPNPTNGAADIVLTMPKESMVRLDIIDVHGTLVKTPFSGHLGTGDHTIGLDARDLPSGTYFYVVTAGDVRLAREMVLVK